ncbi:MAG: cyclic nucleotide-binding domain-containing protein [Anaerolineales bacterium]|nr:cyclic nucleotide-binding domain-containing protein [Anaerolineales bacterium]
MVYEDLDQYVALLEQLYIFEGIAQEQLTEIAGLFERVDVNRGERIFDEGVEGEDFYIIYSGRVLITKTEGDHQRVLAILSEGDYFGEEALINNRPRSASVTALEKTVLLSLNKENFESVLKFFPLVRRHLSKTAESRYLARKEKFEWLGKDELIYLVTRKHEAFLLVSLILPIIIGVGSVPVAGLSILASTAFLKAVALFFGLGGICIALVWGIWKWVDWSNDYYMVTSQRVVRLERVVGIYSSRREAPLANVLTVNVFSSQLGRILNYGDVEVRTYTGGIYMKNLAQPYLLEAYVRGYQERAVQRQEKAELKANQEALHRRMATADGNDEVDRTNQPIPNKEQPQNLEKNNQPPHFLELIKTLFTVRYEQGGAIVYRKHWLVLLKKTWKPTVTFLMLIVLTGIVSWRLISQQPALLSGLNWAVVLFMSYVITFAWWVYHFLDWSNDIYKITPEQILDIERKPLGNEEKKSASLDSILSLEHSRNGILQLIFNYGDVIVNIGQSQFTFRGVNNPDQVHQDVADYMEARQRKKRETHIIQERRRMVDWLDIYHQEAEKFDS